MIFYVLLGVSVFFFFLHLYHAHKLNFCSSSCVFLRYSSSHLDYRYLDLASQRIYVSRHVCFHENVFPLAKSKQIAQPTPTTTQPTNLPTLITSPVFHLAAPPFTPPSGSTAPSAPQKSPNSPPLSTTIPPSHSLALMSPSACFSDDHYVGTGSPPSELHLSKSATTASTDSAASSFSSVVALLRIIHYSFFNVFCGY